MSEIEEIANAIVEINGDIFEITPDLAENYSLTLKSDGGVHTVKFLGKVIYSNDDHDREWNDEKDDYDITVEEYLRSAVQISLQAVEHINNIGSK